MKSAREHAHALEWASFGCAVIEEHSSTCNWVTAAIRAAQVDAIRFALDCAAERFAGMGEIQDKLAELECDRG